jgi:hypothetical protein
MFTTTARTLACALVLAILATLAAGCGPSLAALPSPTPSPSATASALLDYAPTFLADSAEKFAPRSPGDMLALTGTQLRLASGARVTMPTLTLGYLGPRTYADGTPVSRDDVISSPDACDAAAQLRRERDTVFGRMLKGSDGALWLQYWMFYPCNISYGLGDHVGDVELASIRLDPATAKPTDVVLFQHDGAEHEPWPGTGRRTTARVSDGHVDVYIAEGSHALYFEAGKHPTPGGGGLFPDNCDGQRLLDVEVVVLTSRDRWAAWPGAWGQTKRDLLHLAASPHGPGDRAVWQDPARAL